MSIPEYLFQTQMTPNKLMTLMPQDSGGSHAPQWKPTSWLEDTNTSTSKKKMDVELGHAMFGHRSIMSLLLASDAEVWDELTMITTGDSWCDMCKIAIAPRTQRGKSPMRFTGKPLEHVFLDVIPCPATLNVIPECRYKQYLMIADPVSRYIERKGMKDYTALETIRCLEEWRGSLIKKGFNLFIYIRADAGSNFMSEEFKEWCTKQNITLTLAGPKHQEQNSFVERAY